MMRYLSILTLPSRYLVKIAPIYLTGSAFYSLSSLYKPLVSMMLFNEMFNQKDGEISFRIGKSIPWEPIVELILPKKIIAESMRKQVS